MWTQITKEVPKTKYIDIMISMNSLYQTSLSEKRINIMIQNGGGFFYHYQGDKFEIVIGYKYSNTINKYKIMHLGVSGVVDMSLFTDIVTKHIISFAKEKKIDELYAVEPKTMDSIYIIQSYIDFLKYNWITREDFGKFYKVKLVPPKE